MSYSEKYISAVYRFPAGSLTSAATLGRIVGPRGKTGRLMGIGAVVTTGVTVAASSVRVGVVDAETKYGTLSVPISSANSVHNNATINPIDANLIPANTVVNVGSGGGATAGAADILVYIDWF
jgi:hypothetical protein